MNLREKIGYCTNVHAGVSIEQVKSNLENFALCVKNSCFPETTMGIGLWLCNQAARNLIKDDAVLEFRDWLAERNLAAFTFNAFPFHDFHQSIVKHNVYQPTWAEALRLQYTMDIAEIQAALLAENEFGTISTLPLGWPDDTSNEFLMACANNLTACAKSLAELKQRTGRHIFLCIEPEPGCIFEYSDDIVQFFDQFLGSQNDACLRDHIGVCHDVCHAAVMRESQDQVMSNFRDNNIHVGKFQISSAIQVHFDQKSAEDRAKAIEELAAFAEDRYLHQTTISIDGQLEFFEDLPNAIASHKDAPEGVWTIHFHVPIFIEHFGQLQTTSAEINEVLEVISSHSNDYSRFPLHFEVETYAWTLLPKQLQANSLAEGIANELEYFSALWTEYKLKP